MSDEPTQDRQDAAGRYHSWQLGPIYYATYQGPGAQRLALTNPCAYLVMATSAGEREAGIRARQDGRCSMGNDG